MNSRMNDVCVKETEVYLNVKIYHLSELTT